MYRDQSLGFKPIKYLIVVTCVLSVLLFWPNPIPGQTVNAADAVSGNAFNGSPETGASSETLTSSSDSSANMTPKITLETIEALKKQGLEAGDLTDEVKKTISDACDKASFDLKFAGELLATRDKFMAIRQKAPAELEEIKKILATQENGTPADQNLAAMTLDAKEQKLKEVQAELEAARKRASELDNEPKFRSERLAKMPEEVNNARTQLSQIETRLAQIPADMSIVDRANHYMLLAGQQRYQNRLEANREEQLFYDATTEWLTARRDLAARKVREQEKTVAYWQDQVSQARKVEAQKTTEKVLQESNVTVYTHPILKDWSDKNLALAQYQKNLIDKIDTATRLTTAIKDEAARLEKTFEDVRTRLTAAEGVNNVLGVMLLTKRNELPDISTNRQRIRDRARESSQVFMDTNDYDDAWSELKDIDRKINENIAAADPVIPENQKSFVSDELRKVLNTRKEILQKIVGYLQQYASVLASQDAAEQQYVNRTDEFIRFTDEYILWVRSAFPIRLKRDTIDAFKALRWLVTPDNWRMAVQDIWLDFRLNLLVYIPMLLALISLYFARRSICCRIKLISDNVNHSYSDNFMLTVRVVLLTVLAAAPVTLLFLFLGWRSQTFLGAGFSRSLSAGCLSIVKPLALLALARFFCMETGLGIAHFRLPIDKLRYVNRVIQLIGPLYLPTLFIIALVQNQNENDNWYNSLGRFAFMFCQILWLCAIAMLVNPRGPLLRAYYEKNMDKWAYRLRYIWFILLATLPIAFITAAWIGYFYGAVQVFSNLAMTGYVILAVLFLRALLFRWLYIIQLRLTYKERMRKLQEMKRKIAEQAFSESKPDSRSETASLSDELAEKMPDTKEIIGSISHQARALLQSVLILLAVVGTWLIWKNFLPALNAFQKIELWAKGTEDAVTLWNLLLALVIVVMTMVASKNGPGLIEIVFLQHIPLDRGVRFAITTITRYLIVIIGVSLFFTELGIGWSKVQWLVAALSVGLGFGLQEIFANFISGLLILFDQPVRVGDIVTVDNTTGMVTRISIRATTITDWDRKEYIVPNKEFITGRLLNWTLSNSINRVVINVGIAYGSNVELALKLMRQVALDHPRVCKDPEPIVGFEGFGDSSLNLVLRIYLPDIDNRLPVISDMHNGIDQAFRKNGIEIPFPQRDLHIRGIPSEWKQPYPEPKTD